jgi:hypothetical protein
MGKHQRSPVRRPNWTIDVFLAGVKLSDISVSYRDHVEDPSQTHIRDQNGNGDGSTVRRPVWPGLEKEAAPVVNCRQQTFRRTICVYSLPSMSFRGCSEQRLDLFQGSLPRCLISTISGTVIIIRIQFPAKIVFGEALDGKNGE